ncbi:pitrilysin family protein [Prevotella sp. KH2C16]|uniref:M16 family metallopeptidase n=1 Tax=Prevotella sp. KH2C16 TaxID=1855325 RepID=UPI0008E72894|nr:M16 family metallopeptidase [Prevotella sp. KH2C16]SFF86561.1 zinc protease [Prevotella sp. KH2C16]
MKLRHLLVLVLIFVAGSARAQMDMTIPADTAVRKGVLPNGLTYYIRYNNWPEHRANFYIAQKVGSLQEEESQRGLAHFLEHMCFNGTTHFEGNGVIEWCRAHGIEFGADLNAYTSIDETVYNISNVPTGSQGTLDSCLLILSDWADGLILDPKEIDKERGVIHEEWRLRSSASQRMLERALPKLYPGSKYGLRMPIGLMSVVDNFKPKELRDYYEKWYHPTNQGIIVVGDVDVDHTEAMIKKLFGGIKNPENPAPIVDVEVPDTPAPIVIVEKDKEQRQAVAQLMFKHEVFPDSLKGTIVNLIQGYTKGAAMSMLNNRMRETAQQPECPFVNASADDGSYLFSKTKDAFTLGVVPKVPEKTSDALKAVFVEARRAAEFGFTPTEYQRYQEDYLSGLDKVYSNKDKRTNEAFFSQYLNNFLENEPMPSIEYTYPLMKQLVPRIPVQVINEYMKELVPASDSNLVVLNLNPEKEGAVYPTESQLLGALQDARAEKVEAYVDNVKNEPLLAQLPKAGTIKKEVKNDKLGYTELTLSNGIKVVLKKTDYKKDEVRLSGEGDGGSSLYGDKDLYNTKVFNDVIGISGLGNFSSTELQKALAGKIANADLTMSDRKMGLGGSSTPKDVETMFQMAYLYFTKINKDQKSFDNLMNQLELALKNRDKQPDTALSDSLTATLYDHNPRMASLKLDDLKKINYDRILEIAKERTASARGWEFTIIGNYDEATIRPLVCQYLGALPTKGKVVKGHRIAKLHQGKAVNEFRRKMETPKANSYFVWYNEKMPYTVEDGIRADIAGEVLSQIYLKKIREDASAAYSCGAYAGASLSDDGYHVYQILGYCPMKPEKKDIAIKIMNEELPALAKTCDKDILEKVQKTMLKQLETSLKTNTFWQGVIGMQRKYGIDSSYEVRKAAIERQTPASISAFVAEFLKDNGGVSVIMLPEE